MTLALDPMGMGHYDPDPGQPLGLMTLTLDHWDPMTSGMDRDTDTHTHTDTLTDARIRLRVNIDPCGKRIVGGLRRD